MMFVCFRNTVNEVGKGRTSVCPAALNCQSSGFFSYCSVYPRKNGSLGFALLLLLLLLSARIRGTEAPVRAVILGLLAQAEKPRLSQQGTGN